MLRYFNYLAVQLLPAGFEFFLPGGSVRVDDLDGNGAEVCCSSHADRRGIRRRGCISNALHVEGAEYAVAVAEDADLGWNGDFDISHQAVQLELRRAFTQVHVPEIDFDVAHERERPEEARKDPFAFALDVRPPGDCAVSFRNEVVRNGARQSDGCSGLIEAVWRGHRNEIGRKMD